MKTLNETELYTLDRPTCDLLVESAPLMWKWSRNLCKPKPVGGMEEWAKNNKTNESVDACDWYHGTWQYLRILNMVAVPAWYEFYQATLTSILRKKPNALVLISACADYGMLATLHEAVRTVGAKPRIVIYDICNTPLEACKWYAARNNFSIETHCDNIITSTQIPLGSFDLIVTDEFLTVLKAEYKPMITKRWRELLKPGGSIVTTAMIGKPTTLSLRQGFADRARRLMASEPAIMKTGDTKDELLDRFLKFADFHTRHMLVDEHEIRQLFSEFDLNSLSVTVTPGECVNPTSSFQIAATRPEKG